jgi:PKD domain
VRRGATTAAILALASTVAFAAPALAKTSQNRTYHSKGTAVNPSATGDPNDPTSHEDFAFAIKPGEKNGTINVHLEWTNPADDWDLFVYRKAAGGTLQTIGSSAGGAPSNEENAVADSQGIPWRAGSYVIRVVNYAAAIPQFDVSLRFGAFIPYNRIPIARLKAKKHVKEGKPVTLDASASRDPDGRIKNYSFDLDGNGSMEVNNGSRARLTRVLKSGVHHVAVRVTDNEGLRAFANRTVIVGKSK